MNDVTYNRRRQYVIDRRFQFRYLGATLAMVLGFSVLLGAGLWFGLIAKAPRDLEIVQSELKDMLMINGIVIVLLTVFMGLLALILSHRVAGPAYRIGRCLDRIKKGDLDFAVVLRRKDYLHNIADQLNDHMAVLRAHREELTGVAENLKTLAERVPEELAESLLSAAEKIDEVTATPPAEETREKGSD